MKYVITDTSTIQLEETFGVIQNGSSTERVEISNSADFVNSVILYPLNQYTFDTRLYIRGVGSIDQPVEFFVAPFTLGGGAGNSGTQTVDDGDVATDEEAAEYFDSIFSGLGG